jgi:hypothetical protein
MAEKASVSPATAGIKQVSGKERTQFKPGQSGNPAGRTPGSRNKLDELFVEALYKDFKEGGVEAIRACRTEKPDVYLKVIAQVVPKQVDLNADKSVADLADGLHAVAEFLGSFAAEASRADHAGIMPDGPVLSTRTRAQAH